MRTDMWGIDRLRLLIVGINKTYMHGISVYINEVSDF